MGQVGYGRNGVVGQVQDLQLAVAVEVFDALDVVAGQVQNGEVFHVLEALDADDVVVRQVEDTQRVEARHAVHTHQLVVRRRQLQRERVSREKNNNGKGGCTLMRLL